MARGIEFEPAAASWYGFDQKVTPEKIGFVTDDDRTMGCTPDRLIGEDGLLEIKVPSAHTQIGYFVTGQLAQRYKPQLQGQLYVTGRKWVDICGFWPPSSDPDDPRLPNIIIRTERDEDYIEKLDAEMAGFTRYVDLIMERLTNGDEVTPADRRTLAQIRKPVRTLVGARPSSLVGLKAQLQASLAHEDKARSAASAEAQREEVVGDSAQPRGTTAPGEAVADIGAASPLQSEPATADPQPSQGGGGSAATPRKADPPTEVQQPVYHQASGPAEDEENFWTIASRTGDYRADIPDKNIATAGRDQMMNLLRTAPSLAAMRAFYKANEERLDVMSVVRLMSRAEVMKAFYARKKQLDPGAL